MRNNGRSRDTISVCVKYFHTWKKLYEYLTTKTNEYVYFIVKSNWLDDYDNIHIDDFERTVFYNDILAMEEKDLKNWIDASTNLLWFTVEPYFEIKED